MQIDPHTLTRTRQATHGAFDDTAQLVAALTRALAGAPNAKVLSAGQSHAIQMIVVKLARIMSGDRNHPDHWHDIAGYAQLAADGLMSQQKGD